MNLIASPISTARSWTNERPRSSRRGSALAALREREVPLVLASNKTRTEMERFTAVSVSRRPSSPGPAGWNFAVFEILASLGKPLGD